MGFKSEIKKSIFPGSPSKGRWIFLLKLSRVRGHSALCLLDCGQSVVAQPPAGQHAFLQPCPDAAKWAASSVPPQTGKPRLGSDTTHLGSHSPEKRRS